MSRENSPLGQAWRSHVVGQDDIAIQEFKRIATESPDDIDVLYGLALAQKGAGQKEEALANFKRVLELLGDASGKSAEDAARTQMLSRMVAQQISILEGK